MRLARLALVVAVALAMALPAAGAVGSDPALAQQWALRQINASSAWERGVLGGGAPVAVIDTGVDVGHADLRTQVTAAVTCVNTRGDAGRCTSGVTDIEGHGSHVAGIAAAAANDVGVAGVAPEARIVAVRVFQESADPVTGEKGYGATSSDINAAIRWVIANVPRKGAINLSLGGNFVVTTVDGAGFEVGIEEAWKAGWTPVLASGNENVLGVGGSSNYGTLNSLVVGATGPDDERASYSSPFGNAKWGLVAPGGNARSCDSQPERCVLSTYRDGQYAFLQGTSMATPHVAGAVAALMGAGLTNSQAVQRLLDTANKGVSCGSGCKGRLDLAKATQGLGAAAPPAGAPAPAPGEPTQATQAPASAAPAGRLSGSGTRRPAASTVPPAAPAPAAPEAAPPAEEPPPAPTPEEVEEATEPSDAVTDLTLEEALEVTVDPPADPERPSGAVVALAALAALAVTGWAGTVAWRRRQAGAPPG